MEMDVTHPRDSVSFRTAVRSSFPPFKTRGSIPTSTVSSGPQGSGHQDRDVR